VLWPVLCIAALAAAFFWQPLYVDAVDGYEDIVFAIAPSAPRAFAYGERHFSASSPLLYDLPRAERYFEAARGIDPSIPFLYHELARIAFLKGNFTLALQDINSQILLWGDKEPNSYYVRGLIEGYAGQYDVAANDYDHYLQFDPHDWAAINDYTWVLLKAGRFVDASVAALKGLAYFPTNPWLLNSEATALFEMHRPNDALSDALRAEAAVGAVTEAQWLTAYPGNDPASASDGLDSLRTAIQKNVVAIRASLQSATSSTQ